MHACRRRNLHLACCGNAAAPQFRYHPWSVSYDDFDLESSAKARNRLVPFITTICNWKRCGALSPCTQQRRRRSELSRDQDTRESSNPLKARSRFELFRVPSRVDNSISIVRNPTEICGRPSGSIFLGTTALWAILSRQSIPGTQREPQRFRLPDAFDSRKSMVYQFIRRTPSIHRRCIVRFRKLPHTRPITQRIRNRKIRTQSG
jgi:hypothetical protein